MRVVIMGGPFVRVVVRVARLLQARPGAGEIGRCVPHLHGDSYAEVCRSGYVNRLALATRRGTITLKRLYNIGEFTMAVQVPTTSTTVTSDSAGKLSTSTTTYSYGSPVVAKTTAYTVLSSDNGTTFTTTGAVGAVAFTLPTVESGLSFTFVATAAQAMTVVGASSTIKGATSFSGTTITAAAGTASVQYAAVTVRCDGTNWLIVNIQGVMTVA